MNYEYDTYEFDNFKAIDFFSNEVLNLRWGLSHY
jgi:hypothetical protein